MDMYLTDLADALRAAGLDVVEIPGWKTRGRPASTGSFAPKGVLCHHTASSSDSREYVEWMAKVGRSDLPAPLCQLALGRTGVVYVCAAGRSNHAGTAKSSGPMPSGDGNTLYVGIEALNTGSEGWTPAQYDAYVALCAALCRHYKWPASHVRAHKETSVTGKVDPGRMDMDKLRRDVARAIKNPKQEDDLNAEDRKTLNAIAKDVNALRKSQSTIRKADRERFELVLRKVREATRLAQASATPADVRGLLNDIDATITLVVSEADEAARS